jgi:hypothetical protein
MPQPIPCRPAAQEGRSARAQFHYTGVSAELHDDVHLPILDSQALELDRRAC